MANPSETADTAKQPNPEGSVKETIESILVAFILAFVFRAFVVEAFVIPTGSMSTTLLGAHTRFHCPDCGYSFDVDYHAREDPNNPKAEPYIPDVCSPARPVYCPNCGYDNFAEQR